MTVIAVVTQTSASTQAVDVVDGDQHQHHATWKTVLSLPQMLAGMTYAVLHGELRAGR